MPEAAVFRASDLQLGMKASYERDITTEDILAFARLSGDHNPLHVDPAYAKSTNYGARIAHGAFQVRLASALIGMHLPGRQVVLGTIQSRFPAPLFFPTRVRVLGELTSWDVQSRAGQLKVTVQEVASAQPTAEIVMAFTLHEERAHTEGGPVAVHAARPAESDARKAVLITGASGGLGGALTARLAETYRLIAVVNSRRMPTGAAPVAEIEADLTSEDAAGQLRSALGDTPLYGVVHAAWPGAPRGGLLQSDPTTIRLQLEFGSTVPVMLARLLFDRVDANGGRFIAIGSTAGTAKPYLQWASYSLAKACLEQTVRLLAPELARKKITVNAICPSFIPVGINKQATARQQLTESANVPLGRLCEAADVAAMIGAFLSPDAAFVSGQVIGLTGGQI